MAAVGASLAAGAGVIARSRGAMTSARTAMLLRVGAGMSVTAAAGVLIWASAIIPDDEPLNQHMDYWQNMAAKLDATFGSGDPAGREALSKAWSGETMKVADRKLRDFVTAGIQLSDEAVGRGYDLAQAVDRLNNLHDWTYLATAVQIALLIAVRTYSPVNPAAALTMSSLIGHRLTLMISLVYGLIVASTGALYANMDGQPTKTGPANVPQTDFPMV
ncbi:hypothetical protein [Nonomuraea cavernae]|nr:hypothetical protein [Nonomuraea cavernae]MCA2185844.1 hypothetical protein [Nonomuraea cavernae]